jgi:hypothetical protein
MDIQKGQYPLRGIYMSNKKLSLKRYLMTVQQSPIYELFGRLVVGGVSTIQT